MQHAPLKRNLPGLAVVILVFATVLAEIGAMVGAAPAAAAVSASYPNVVFSDGFDSNSLSKWTGFSGTGRASVTAAAAHDGAAGLRLTNGSGQYSLEVKQLSAPLTDSATSFWVRVNSPASGFSGPNTQDIAEARNKASSTDVWQLLYDPQQQGLWFVAAQGNTEHAIFTGAGTMPLGSWSSIEVRYTATTTGGAQILINGKTQPRWSMSGNYTRTSNLQVVQLWNDAAASTDFDGVLVASPGSSGGGSTVSPPANTALPVVSGTAQQGRALSATSGSWSGSPTSYAYKWQDCDSSGVNCAAISGATSSGYTLGAGDVGHTIRAVVTATNAGGSTPASSAQTALVAAPPAPPAPPANTTLPAVSGTAQQGQALSATNGSWSGSPTSYAYKWQDCDSSGANCVAISGATSSGYTLGAGDVGRTIRAVVTATNASGSTAATSAQTAPVAGSSGGGGGGGGGGVTPSTGQSVAFWLAWDGSMSPSQIPWNAVTQVDLFALQTTAGTGLDTSSLGINQMNVPQWVSTVHQHKRLAIITVGGISDQHWDTACNDTNRSGFVSNLINYMVSNGFDGVDIDIEQTNWGSQQAPVAAWDTCVQAIAQAAHAATTAAGAKPIVSTDVDQTWMDPYVAGFASYPDQFNLMGYTNNCNNSCMAAQVQDLLSTGKVSSAAKMTMGVDVDAGDTGQTVTPAQCGSIAQYASTAGLGGVMLWTVQGDGASHPCLNQIAPSVAPAP